LIDGRVSKEAKEALSRYCDIIEFHTRGITYEAVSGHPDLFFCKLADTLVTAANLPVFYQDILKKRGIVFVSGTHSVGNRYPETARYNAAATDAFLVHRLDITDPRILESAAGLEKISVDQGYARCSLLPLERGRFISSDAGITAALVRKGLEALHIENKNITLPGFECGFFGGTCGLFGGRVFVIGSLDYFPDGEAVRRYLGAAGYEIVELADSPLYDGGGILFL